MAKENFLDSIGIDLVEFPPYTIKGDYLEKFLFEKKSIYKKWKYHS